MNLRENIRISVHNLKQNRLRSILIILAVAAGICCMFVVVSIGQGSRNYVKKEFEGVGVNTLYITVAPEVSTKADRITFEDVRLLKSNIASVTYATPIYRLNGEGKTEPFYQGTPLTVLAGNADLAHVMNYKISAGRFFTEDEFDNARQVAVLDKRAAKEIFGFENAVGQSIEVTVSSKRMRLTIVGLTEKNDASLLTDTQESFLSIPATTLLNTIGGEERTDSCYLVVDDASLMEQTADVAEQYLGVRHNNQDKNIYQANHVAQYMDMMNQIQSLFFSFGMIVTVVVLLLSGISVMSIMLLSVHQRAKEIGIRKAMGARTRTVLVQFLLESVILCLIGSVGGMVLGIIFSWLIAPLIGISPVFHVVNSILIPIFSSLVGIICGIIPAQKAAKLQPADALRQE